MKTSYLPDKKNSLSRKISILLFAGIFVFFVFRERSVIYDELVYFSLEISRPVWKIRDDLSKYLFGVMVLFQNNKDLLVENEILKKEILIMDERLAVEKILREENLVLKKMLGRTDLVSEFPGDVISLNKDLVIDKKGTRSRAVVSAVILGMNLFPFNVLILDSGQDLGVLPGDVIIKEPGLILGEIVEVSRSTSKVELFSAYGKKTGVYMGQENVMVSIEGIGGGNYRVILPSGFKVKEGDRIKYPGIEDLFVGEVSQINSDVNSSYKEVIVSTPFNIRQTDLVKIIPGQY